MDKDEAESILLEAISEAYPIASCYAFKEDYDRAKKALDFLLKSCENND